MRYNLNGLQSGKLVTKEIGLAREELGIANGRVVLENIDGKFRFQIDPSGFVVHYHIRGRVVAECVRCGKALDLDIDTSDWISLRTAQPNQSHIVLDDSEMNVRFITDSKIDLKVFTREVIELELPSYPRHEENHPSCRNMADPVSRPSPNSSPFETLSKYLGIPETGFERK